MKDGSGNFTDHQLNTSNLSTLKSPYQKLFSTMKNIKIQHFRTVHSGLSVMEKGDENHFQGLFS